jgi:hypothetical protein
MANTGAQRMERAAPLTGRRAWAVSRNKVRRYRLHGPAMCHKEIYPFAKYAPGSGLRGPLDSRYQSRGYSSIAQSGAGPIHAVRNWEAQR